MTSRPLAQRLNDGRHDDIATNVARCVQCGLCNAACPTYQLDHDERDGPRGRITMIRDMFARGYAPGSEVRKHIGRCLSCLACESACPTGVEYGRLISQLAKCKYDRSLSVNMTQMVGVDHSAEMRKMRLLLESLL